MGKIALLLFFCAIFVRPAAAAPILRSTDITGTLSYDNVGVSPHPALAGPRAFAPFPPNVLLSLIRALQSGELPGSLNKAEESMLGAPASYPSAGVEYGAFFRARLIALARGGHEKKAFELLQKLPAGAQAPLAPGTFVALSALSENYAAICGNESRYAPDSQGSADETRLFCAALFDKNPAKIGMLVDIIVEQYPEGAPVRRFATLIKDGKQKQAAKEWRAELLSRYFPAEKQPQVLAPRPQLMPPGFADAIGTLNARPALAAGFFDKLYVYSNAEDAPLAPEELFQWLHFFASRSMPLPDSLTVALQAENEKLGVAGDAPALLLLLYRMHSGMNPYEAVTLSRDVRLLSRTGFAKAAKSLTEEFISARPATTPSRAKSPKAAPKR